METGIKKYFSQENVQNKFKDPNIALIKDNFTKIKSAINGNEYNQRAIAFIENVIRERVSGYSV